MHSTVQVIHKLAEASKNPKKANEYVPYRDSKLTRLLASSLGGNACTAVVCAISPARCNRAPIPDDFAATMRSSDMMWCSRNYEESKTTLGFASHCKSVAMQTHSCMPQQYSFGQERYTSMP